MSNGSFRPDLPVAHAVHYLPGAEPLGARLGAASSSSCSNRFPVQQQQAGLQHAEVHVVQQGGRWLQQAQPVRLPSALGLVLVLVLVRVRVRVLGLGAEAGCAPRPNYVAPPTPNPASQAVRSALRLPSPSLHSTPKPPIPHPYLTHPWTSPFI